MPSIPTLLRLPLLNLSFFQSERTVVIDGQRQTDLLHNDLPESIDLSNTDRQVYVDDIYEGRPDLLSISAYGDASYADIILHYNGISNPFAVQKGMVLAIPSQNYARSFQALAKQTTPQVNKSKEELNKKLPSQDKRRLLEQVEIGEIKSPNMPLENTTPTVTQNGQIELGTNVSTKKCKDNLTSTQLLSERIRSAVKDKFAGVGPVSVATVSLASLDSPSTGIVSRTASRQGF